jgi:hypothetical protein
MKTIDRINIHKKQTQHDILIETINKKTENMFYVAKGGGATPYNHKCISFFIQ